MKKLIKVKCNVKASKKIFVEQIDKKIQTLPGELPRLICFLSSASPYIKRLVSSELDWLSSVIDEELDEVLSYIVICCKNKIHDDTFSQIRIAKRRAILVISLADFGKVFSLMEVTTALSVFADKILEVVMDLYTFNEFQRVDYRPFFKKPDFYPKAICDSATDAGLSVLGMGKLGSFELNYSSDIDLIFLFDEERFKPESYSKIRNAFIIVIRKIVKALSEVTSEGYVFRVDLRLRPDPSSNPICIGVLAAQRYYENFGRNWERAAFIKARPVAGNKLLGRTFLESLNSFIWRKNLDFAAIDDINDIRKKIRQKNPGRYNNNLLGYNIKTGIGGIREIEFFVQTQQLIQGGKNKTLRKRATVVALGKLEQNKLISLKVHNKLVKSYTQLRTLEHILQLIQDSQTHSIPSTPDKVKNVALLYGISDIQSFLRHVFNVLDDVNSIINELYSQFDPVGEKLALTEENPKSDEFFVPYINKWLKYKALRSERSLKIFDELLPSLKSQISKTEDASNTIFHFDNFLKSLSFGVQILSLFKANPAVLDLLIDICGAAPALAHYLGKNPSVLDVVTDQSFFLPLATKDELFEEFFNRISETTDYESILDSARIFVKENQFRTGVHLLKGFSTISDISRSFSNIAEVCLVILFSKVQEMFSERYGNISGMGSAILAMGKLGSEEMSISSDLDLILIYHCDSDVVSTGKNSVPAQVYYSRLTQAFISAITVATSEGHLFKVDMRLRPSGNNGPIATSITSFENYQVNDAWVWERLALSRGRVLNGNLNLQSRINKSITKALNSTISANQITREVHQMRLRLNKKSQKHSSFIDIKLGAGRLKDLELLIQMGALLEKRFNSTSPYNMITDLNELNFFNDDEFLLCKKAYLLYFSLQQVLNITVKGQIEERSVQNIRNMLKIHDFVDLPNDIDNTLNDLSKSIDDLFKSKLANA